MNESPMKVGPSPDFVMTKGKIEYFHSISFSVLDTDGVRLDSNKFSFRSFKSLIKCLLEYLKSRFTDSTGMLTVDAIDVGKFYVKTDQVVIEVKYRLEEHLTQASKKRMLDEIESLLRQFCIYLK